MEKLESGFGQYLKEIHGIDISKEYNFYKEHIQKKDLYSIIHIACDMLGTSYEKVVSKSRKRELVKDRQVIMWILYNDAHGSLAKIGGEFNGRDHSTVIHSKYAVDDGISTKDDMITRRIESLQSIMSNKLWEKYLQQVPAKTAKYNYMTQESLRRISAD